MKKIALLAVVATALTMASCNNSSNQHAGHDHADHDSITAGDHVDAAIADLQKAEADAKAKAEQAKKI